jgi:hypothetical protein
MKNNQEYKQYYVTQIKVILKFLVNKNNQDFIKQAYVTIDICNYVRNIFYENITIQKFQKMV